MKLIGPFIKLNLISICLLFFGCSQQSNEPPPDLFGFSFIGYDTLSASLSPSINETSGVILVKGKYWTHNDSGNQPLLFQFDPVGGQVTKSIEIEGVNNKDWEAIAHDNSHIYIGDFGNNLGSRDDLVIYKFPTDELDSASIKNIEAIAFKFPDQSRFAHSYNHNFDLEAMLVLDETIYLFTKNWANKKCKLYRLKNTSGEQVAEYISEFDSKGLITDASFDPENRMIVLLGYNYHNYNTPFVWLLTNFNDDNPFAGKKTRFNLDLNRQVEGICFIGKGQYLLTSEKGSNSHAAAYQIQL